MSGHHPIVYLNGELKRLDQARVSVLDRGFLLGDGVYEVIPAYGGRLFRCEQHLARLERSLAAVRIPNPMDRGTWSTVLDDLVQRNGGGDQSVYLQITRGTANRRDHVFSGDLHPTVLVMSSPIEDVGAEVAEAGVAAVTLEDIRWKRCDIKAITLLPNVLLRQQALDTGAAEAILIRAGHATEGAASNLFIVGDGLLTTPPKGPQLLPGITRDLVLELAQAHGIGCRETPVTTEALHAAAEIWLTSSTREILPVTRLDGQAVGTGRPGPVWTRMHGLYQEYKERLRHGGAAATTP